MAENDIISAIRGETPRLEYNWESCVRGVPLGVFCRFVSQFEAGEISLSQLRGYATVALNIHRQEIGNSLHQALEQRWSELNDNGRDVILPHSLDELIRPMDPKNWSPALSRREIFSRAKMLDQVLTKAVDLALSD